jgi:hypothetical protein
MPFQHFTLYTGFEFSQWRLDKRVITTFGKNGYEKERLNNLEILKIIIVSEFTREKCI